MNLAFWGHNHALQRQSAVFNKEVVQLSTAVKENGNITNKYYNPQATVHMVVGTGGMNSIVYNYVYTVVYADIRMLYGDNATTV